MNIRTRHCTGLIMVEAALAVVVLSIGVLAVFVLFSSGMSTKTKASGDTQAALFAQGVFSTLRAASEEASRQGQVRWEEFWYDIEGNTNLLPAAGAEFWANSNMMINANTLTPIVYSIPLTNGADMVNHALRYILTVDLDLAITNWPDRVPVTLKVWEGAFGQTNDDDAAVFYTEFDNPGDL